MSGALSEKYAAWRSELAACLAHSEAAIDFGDDEIVDDVDEAAIEPALRARVGALRAALDDALVSGVRGEIVRSGLVVAIAGAPNAGKSSLLNAIARRPAAIVTDVPGTTRDVIEARSVDAARARPASRAAESGARARARRRCGSSSRASP